MNILSKILAHKRTEVKARADRRPLAQVRQDALSAPPPRGFARALARPGLSVIAEFKRASPSAGKIADLDSALVAANYQAAGAACLSVLTDRRFFGGSDHDLVSARAACDLPVLRKDFVVDPWQIFEARALGADAVLVIMAAIDDPRPLLAAAAEVGIDALVEVHDRSELERALAVGAGLIGINNRDLSTFATDLATTEELAPLALGRALVVGESGVKDGDRSGPFGSLRGGRRAGRGDPRPHQRRHRRDGGADRSAAAAGEDMRDQRSRRRRRRRRGRGRLRGGNTCPLATAGQPRARSGDFCGHREIPVGSRNGCAQRSRNGGCAGGHWG